MTTYKYIDTTNLLVMIIDDDGISRSSGMKTIVPDGVDILPADIPPEPPAPTLDELRNAAYAKIDEAAYQTRLKFITPHKDSTYLAKSVQMDAYVAAGYPMDLTNFGYIKAEVARLGGDVSVQADLITAADGLIAIRNAWLSVDAIIEEIALVAKTSISKKLKDTTIQAVVDQALTDFGAI